VLVGTSMSEVWSRLRDRRAAQRSAEERRRELLVDVYERQSHCLEEFEGLLLRAYHVETPGGLAGVRMAADHDALRRSVMAFRTRAVLAFGDEQFANELMAVIFMHEDAATRGNFQMSKVVERAERVNAQMLHAIREVQRDIGLPEIRVTAKTDRAIEKLLEEHGVGITRALPPRTE